MPVIDEEGERQPNRRRATENLEPGESFSLAPSHKTHEESEVCSDRNGQKEVGSISLTFWRRVRFDTEWI